MTNKRSKRDLDNNETAQLQKDIENQIGSNISPLLKEDDQGQQYLELSKYKRASARNFKGNLTVDIREFFMLNDELKPTKKGISLNMEQWDILKQNFEYIDQMINNLKKLSQK